MQSHYDALDVPAFREYLQEDIDDEWRCDEKEMTSLLVRFSSASI